MHKDINPASERSTRDYRAATVMRAEHTESSLTRLLEQQAAKVPSDVFLFASLCSMAFSLGAELLGHERAARFTGMWVGPLLIMGVYTKMVKTFGAS
ncbi:hypothetical protein [Melittangium boletus]|uniref:Uncharacterized protein n=1 Tax=Melittangium boletus DSM 14713 TaxID=1294270 RepID=A0A250IM72_9BACT|nr:hypothetical protein [Melittangium boletus]ATB32281.1 hypothetical protein MEBOL_005758 [Melittangium boletus DSM 14713]